MAKGRKKGNGLLSPADFVTKAILALRDKSKSMGVIPSMPGGLNDAIRGYYGDATDPKELTKKLADDGVIVIQPRKGYVMIYLPGDEPKGGRSEAKAKKDVESAVSRVLAFEGF